MKIITVFGTRPEIIKLSLLIPLLDDEFEQVLVHTGQHYSWEMDELFFEELGVRKPNYNLNVGSGNQGEQTGRIITELEKVLLKEKPEMLIVLGDTNSTLAGTLAASKHHCKVIHLEAGCRSRNRYQPEEINRIVADHCSDILFTIDNESTNNLLKEGFKREQIFLVGNLIEEACHKAVRLETSKAPASNRFILVTIHRAENTENPENLKNIVTALNALSEKIDIFFPAHPRTKKVIEEHKIFISPKVKVLPPQGYVSFISHLVKASFVITDSGGVMEEAAFLNIPILVPREKMELHELIELGKAQLVGADAQKIITASEALLQEKNDNQKLIPKEQAISRNIISIIKKNLPGVKRILVTGAGGSPAVNFTRSLRAAPEQFYLIGTDSSKYYLQRAETDECHLIVGAKDKDYIEILSEIIRESHAELLHVQNDVEMEIISENREKLPINLFLPSKETVRICMNKLESYKRWEAEGIKQPKTMLIDNEDDLRVAFEKFGPKIWLRDTTGAGGRGSLPASDIKVAKSWMDFKEGWGKYTAAECLEPNSVTWMSVWDNGKLIVAQGRERLYWELSKISPSGVTGATGGGVTVSDPLVDDIAVKAILAIDKKPHGIFSVDLTYDKYGVPCPTEINIGRFFTTHEFFTRAGLNMPYILVKLAFGEPIQIPDKNINPLPAGLVWIRGMDFLPVLTTTAEIEKEVAVLEERRKRHAAQR